MTSTIIEKLLQGAEVEWKFLEEVANISTGSSNTNEGLSTGLYPFFVRSQEVRYKDNFEFDETAIITSGDGVGVGKIFHFVQGKYALHQRAYRINISYPNLDAKFFFYFMKNNFAQYILGAAFHASVTSVRRPMLNKYPVPIPPLSVQEEIVRILDAFTGYTAELTAELNQRQKQYNHYRDTLLTFNDDEVEWKALKDVAKIKNGKDWKKLNSGEIPVYGTGGIMGYVDDFSYNKPTVLIPRKGTLTNIFYLEKPFWNVDTIYYTVINNEIVLPKFFYYYIKTIDFMKLDTGTGRPSLTQAILDPILIPIPPLAEQQRIVDILDKFETLTTSITQGLPREIELRQKQYEYYREQLLNFPKPQANMQ